MATIAEAVSGGGISLGRVYDRAFATLRRNPLVTFGLALLLGGAPAVGINFLTRQVPAEAFVMTVGSLVLPGAIAVLLVQLFFGQVIGVIVLGAMTRPVVAESEGRTASFGESLLAPLKVAVSLVGLGIIIALGVVLGTTLIVLPGMILYLLWAVAVPALVEEREGAFLSLSRSQELSEGARWKTAGIMLVLLVGTLLLGVLIGLVERLVGLPASEISIGLMACWLVLGTIVNLVWSLVQASLYVELRDWRDGPAAGNLEQIFA